jgi:two-component system, LytTR family, response regulator LytT
MRVLIIEDEPLSAERAKDLVSAYSKQVQVLDILDSVEDTLLWFSENPEPDLVLLDIHLSDGLSFEIFKKIKIKCPIIFITAYDQYAIEAFKINSIDYLLKPLDATELHAALEKYQERYTQSNPDTVQAMMHLLADYQNLQKRKTKDRFLVKIGDQLQIKSIQDIAYFFADDKSTYLVSNDKRKFIIDYKLERLEDMLDLSQFYRINRKILVKLDAISKIKYHMSRRYQLILDPAFEQEVFVSKEKTNDFKTWLSN